MEWGMLGKGIRGTCSLVVLVLLYCTVLYFIESIIRCCGLDTDPDANVNPNSYHHTEKAMPYVARPLDLVKRSLSLTLCLTRRSSYCLASQL